MQRALDPAQAKDADDRGGATTTSAVPLALNEDAMATEKLAEGIRAFAADAVKLEQLMQAA